MQGEELRGPKRSVGRALPGLLVLILYLLFALLDPFGVEGAIKRHAYQAASRIAGLCYLQTPWWNVCTDDLAHRQSQVAVVLIDDAYMAERDGGWPVSWRHHAGLLRSIADLKPRAIFLDFAYHRPRIAEESGQARSAVHRQLSLLKDGVGPPRLPSAQGEIDALRMAIEETDVPVVIGEIPVPGHPPPTYWRDVPELREVYRRRCPVKPEADRSPQDLHPSHENRSWFRPMGPTSLELACAAAGVAPIAWTTGGNPFLYPLKVAPFGSDGPGFLTPAPALLRAVKTVDQFEHLSADDKMLVAWRLRGSALELRRSSNNCDMYSPVFLVAGSIFPGIEQNWIAADDGPASGPDGISVISGRPGTKVEPCLAIDAVSALAVEHAPDADAAPGGPKVRELLRDRFVLVGSGRGAGDPDVVRTAIGGEVPGVLLHAMALDNLLQFGPGQYWKTRESIWYLEMSHADLAGFIALVLAILTKYLVEWSIHTRTVFSRSAILRWTARRSPFIVTFLTIFGLNFVFHYGTVEIIVSVVLVTAFKAIIDVLSNEKYWPGFPTPAPTASPLPSLPAPAPHPDAAHRHAHPQSWNR